MVALLLQHGFSGLEQDNNGATPLHHAVRSSAVPSGKYIIILNVVIASIIDPPHRRVS